MTIFLLAHNRKGAILIAALVFLSILSIMGFALNDLVIVQNRLAKIKVAEEYSFQIAEAGLNYGRWRLAHDPQNFTPETLPLSDPEGGSVGNFTVEFTPFGTDSTVVEIQSTGWHQDQTNLSRIISARYGRKAFTFYAFLFDSPVWFGNPAVNGRVHSNSGIRMDATGNSKVTSAVASYVCGTMHDCDPPATKPGIWGAGGNQDLWEFPVSNIDFNGVTTNLAVLKDLTENQGVGLFLDGIGVPKGYDLNFLADGRVEIYKINTLKGPVKRMDHQGNYHTDSLDIESEEMIFLYTLQPNDLIFAEANLWVRGVINGRATVVAAKLPDVAGQRKNIMLGSGYYNLTYSSYDGSIILGLIAQQNIMISLEVPDNMRIDAVLMAQKGYIGRDGYFSWLNPPAPCCGVRNSITTYGSMISKDFSNPEFRWVNQYGQTTSGFQTNSNSYDPHLVYNPPPYFPISGDYDFISWEEK